MENTIIDGLNGLFNLCDNSERLLKNIIENTYFFCPDIVEKQAKELLSNEEGSPLFIRKSNGIDYYDKDKNIINSNKAATLNKQACYIKLNDEFVGIKVDYDGNKEVRRQIRKYTGYRVSEGENNNFVNYTITHIWGNTNNRYYFSFMWNYCLTPSYAAFITDKSNKNKALQDSKKFTELLQKTLKTIAIKLYNPVDLMGDKIDNNDFNDNDFELDLSLIELNFIGKREVNEKNGKLYFKKPGPIYKNKIKDIICD